MEYWEEGLKRVLEQGSGGQLVPMEF
jgi:hypothetical protein